MCQVHDETWRHPLRRVPGGVSAVLCDCLHYSFDSHPHYLSVSCVGIMFFVVFYFAAFSRYFVIFVSLLVDGCFPFCFRGLFVVLFRCLPHFSHCLHIFINYMQS